MSKKSNKKIQNFSKLVVLTLFLFIGFYHSVSAQPIVCNPPLVINWETHTCVNPSTGENVNTDPTNNLLINLDNLDPLSNITGEPVQSVDTYTLLQPLGSIKVFDPKQNCAFVQYLNLMIKVFLIIAAILSMVMIVMGGIEYMTSELISSKEAGKERITNAILGLLIAMGAWLILNTINPNLLNLCVDRSTFPKASFELSPESIEHTIGVEGSSATVSGFDVKACDESKLVLISLMNKQVRVTAAVVDDLVGDLESVSTKWNATLNTIRGKKTAARTAEDKYTLKYNVGTIYGFDCRSVKNQPKKASAHSFGVALDINPKTNPFNYKKCITDMPPKFVQAFTSSGFGWGGNWSSVKDAMHFSKLPSESRLKHLGGLPKFSTIMVNNEEISVITCS